MLASDFAIEVGAVFTPILGGLWGLRARGRIDGERQASQRRQLSPEEKWEIFLDVTSQPLTQADCARKWGIDVSTVTRIRQLAKDAALAAFAASKPGRMPPVEQVELEEARARSPYTPPPPGQLPHASQ